MSLPNIGWNRWSVPLVALALASGAVVGGWALVTGSAPRLPHRQSSEPEGDGASADAIGVEPGDLELGDVWETNLHRHTLRLRNQTDQPLLISGFVTSCACGQIHPKQLALPARGGGTIQLSLDLTSYRTQSGTTKLPVREVEPVRLGISARGPGGEALGSWQVVARVRPVLGGVPSNLNLGRTFRSLRTNADGIMVLDLVPAVQDLKITEPAAAGKGVLEWEKTVSGRLAKIQIRPAAHAPFGRFATAVQITPITASGPLPPFFVPVEGEMLGDVAATPSALMFGVIEGPSATQSVTLSSVSGRDVVVEHVEVGRELREAVNVVRATSDKVGVTVYNVQVRSSVPGPHSGVVRFRTVSAGSAPDILEIPIHFHTREP